MSSSRDKQKDKGKSGRPDRSVLPDTLIENDLLGSLMDVTSDYVYAKDTNSRFVFSNRAHLDVLGIENPDQAIGKSDFDFFPGELAERYFADEQNVIRTGEPILGREEPYIDTKGNRGWVSTNKVPWRDSRNRVIGIIGISRDVTRQIVSRQRLQKLSECFLSFTTSTDSNIGRLTALCGELTNADSAIYNRVEGAMLCSIGLYKPPSDFTPVDRAHGHVCYEVIRRADKQPLVIHDLQNSEYAATDPTVSQNNFQTYMGLPVRCGETCVGSLSVFFAGKKEITEEDSRLSALIAAAIGIEEDRKRDEDALQESEEQFRNLVENTSDWVWEVNEDLVYTYSNPRIHDLLGYSAEEVIGKRIVELLPEKDTTRLKTLFETVCSQRKPFFLLEKTLVNKAGEEVVVETSGTPIFDNDGVFHGYRGIDRDVTERKRLEEARAQVQQQLNQALKLESVGQLAAGIAHEINTPTQFVGVNIHFMKDAFKDILSFVETCEKVAGENTDSQESKRVSEELENAAEEADMEYLKEEIPKAIDQSQEGIARISKIVSAMKDFSHPDMGGKTAVDINKAIETTITIARNEWKYVAEMNTDLDPRLTYVSCLPGDFNQVILNLVVNAAQAIAETVKKDSSEKGRIKVSTRRDGDWAEIRISDTGPGIPEKIQSKIFDPFFTTKEVGKGTGQGLSIVYNIVVNKHQGSIKLETEQGKGTTFVVRIPIGEPEEPNQDGLTDQ